MTDWSSQIPGLDEVMLVPKELYTSLLSDLSLPTTKAIPHSEVPYPKIGVPVMQNSIDIDRKVNKYSW